MKKLTFKQYGKKLLFTLIVVFLAGGLVACAKKQMSAADKGEIQSVMNAYIQEKTSLMAVPTCWMGKRWISTTCMTASRQKAISISPVPISRWAAMFTTLTIM